MRLFIPTLSVLLILLISSCQQEPDIILDDIDPNPTADTIPHISTIFKVVELRYYTPTIDSLVRIVKQVVLNGQKKVIMADVYPEDPTDTLYTVFSYDTQDRLTGIISGFAANLTEIKYQFTWNGNRLTRMTVDTLGVFAESSDYSYATSGSNTIVTNVDIPSYDISGPDYTYAVKHRITLNSQSVPVEEQWIAYTHITTDDQTRRDTSNVFYTYSGNELVSSVTYGTVHDVNIGMPFSLRRDTLSDIYSRASGSTNIADSLKKIYGPQLFYMLNFGLLNLSYIPEIVTYREQDKFFISRPINTIYNSRKTWINGVFSATDTYTDMLRGKMDNEFDANGRLSKATVYWDNSPTDVDHVVKIYY